MDFRRCCPAAGVRRVLKGEQQGVFTLFLVYMLTGEIFLRVFPPFISFFSFLFLPLFFIIAVLPFF